MLQPCLLCQRSHFVHKLQNKLAWVEVYQFSHKLESMIVVSALQSRIPTEKPFFLQLSANNNDHVGVSIAAYFDASS